MPTTAPGGSSRGEGATGDGESAKLTIYLARQERIYRVPAIVHV